MAQPPPAKRQKCNEDNDIVKIRTVDGEDTKIFKYLTVHYAPKFAAVIQFPGVKPIELTHVTYSSLCVFNGWVLSSWLYDRRKNRLPAYAQGWEPKWELLGRDIRGGSGTPLSGSYCFMSLFLDRMVSTFLFAETFDIPRLRQDALDRLVWCLKKRDRRGHVSVETVKQAYEHTQAGSPLRRVLVDSFHVGADERKREWWMQLPKEFLVDIVQRSLLDKTALERMPDACEYHEHETEEARKSCESRIFPREA